MQTTRKAVKQRLEKRLEETRQELASLDKRLESKGDYGPGTGDPLVVRWELNLALQAKMARQAERLEEALERVEEGGYGICESCQKPIDPERLEALPGATLCIRCAREAEAAHAGR